MISVSGIRSKSVSGDPPCSSDPEGKVRGSVGEGGGQGSAPALWDDLHF